METQETLHDGAIQVHAVAEQGFVRVDLRGSIEPMRREAGRLSLRVVTADSSVLPMPDSVKERISSLITEAPAGSVGPHATGIRLQAVTIDDGEMASSGQLR
jgi:hypothetical protein